MDTPTDNVPQWDIEANLDIHDELDELVNDWNMTREQRMRLLQLCREHNTLPTGCFVTHGQEWFPFSKNLIYMHPLASLICVENEHGCATLEEIKEIYDLYPGALDDDPNKWLLHTAIQKSRPLEIIDFVLSKQPQSALAWHEELGHAVDILFVEELAYTHVMSDAIVRSIVNTMIQQGVPLLHVEKYFSPQYAMAIEPLLPNVQQISMTWQEKYCEGEMPGHIEQDDWEAWLSFAEKVFSTHQHIIILDLTIPCSFLVEIERYPQVILSVQKWLQKYSKLQKLSYNGAGLEDSGRDASGARNFMRLLAIAERSIASNYYFSCIEIKQTRVFDKELLHNLLSDTSDSVSDISLVLDNCDMAEIDPERMRPTVGSTFVTRFRVIETRPPSQRNISYQSPERENL
jgi:hypothetical protein